jgi:hypothetical protein
MKFSTKEDIDAPIDAVFAFLSDFGHFERLALGRGIDVQRRKTGPEAHPAWDIHLEYQGKPRDVALALSACQPPTGLCFDADSSGLAAVFTLALEPLSPHRTRMAVAIEVTPRTMAARLLLQPLKLAKSGLTTRFKLKVADYAKQLEERLARST